MRFKVPLWNVLKIKPYDKPISAYSIINMMSTSCSKVRYYIKTLKLIVSLNFKQNIFINCQFMAPQSIAAVITRVLFQAYDGKMLEF